MKVNLLKFYNFCMGGCFFFFKKKKKRLLGEVRYRESKGEKRALKEEI